MGNPSNSMKCPEILDIDSHIYLSLPKKRQGGLANFWGRQTTLPARWYICKDKNMVNWIIMLMEEMFNTMYYYY